MPSVGLSGFLYNALMNGESQELPRAFGFWSGAALVAASMIGTGILVTPGYTAVGLGSHVSAIILWIAGGVLALCGALTLAEMASAMPKVGGEYVYVAKAWGPSVGFAYGWATLLIGFVGPTAAVALAAAKFLIAGLPEPSAFRFANDGFSTPAFACLLVVLLTFVHCLGQRSSGWVQGTTTAFKYLTLLALAAVGWSFAFRTGSWHGLWDLAPPGAAEPVQSAALGRHVKSLLSIPFAAASALVFISYTYVGWNGAAYIAGEVRDAPRQVPRALVAGCLAVTALYVAIALAFGFVYSVAEIEALRASNELDVLALKAMERALPYKLTKPAASAIIGFGLIATISAFLFTGSRVMVAMAQSKQFPAMAGVWSSRLNAPVAALVTLGIPTAALVWYGDLEKLLEFLGLGLNALGVLFGIAIFLLRAQPDYQPPFRTPFYPVPPLIYLGSCLFILGMCMNTSPLRTALAIGIVLLGAPIHWAISRPPRP